MMHYKNEDAILIANMMSLDNYPRHKVVASVQRTVNKSYCMLNCDENYLCHNDIYTGLYKSVVFSFPERELLSYSPSKTINYSYFKELFPILSNEMIVSEYIQGVMVQLFYDHRINAWEIGSTDIIGGANQVLFNNKSETLKHIFVEALRGYNDDLKTLPFLEYFPISCSFSFILQFDPKHSTTPVCYLIAVYYINDILPNTVKYIHENVYKSWDCIQCISGLVKFPNNRFFTSYIDIEEDVNFMHENQKYIITHLKNGVKTTLQTTEYTIQEKINKEKKVDIYRFLCLNRVDDTHSLCSRFDALKNNLYKTKQIYNLFLSYIHKIYRDYFIMKTSTNIPYKYKKHILEIHKIYYTKKIKKNQKKPIVMRSNIQTYFNKRMPHEMYMLMYKS